MSVSRKQIAQAFKAAKARLSKTHMDGFGKYEYICWALSHSVDNESVLLECRKIITNRINRHVTLAKYLTATYPHLAREIDADFQFNSGRKMQETRRAWLDSLIEEYSN